jgi:spore germination protein GerM
LKRLILVLVVLVLAAAAFWIIHGRLGAPPAPEGILETEKVRTVTLYYGSADGTSLVPEVRTIPSRDNEVENLRSLVEALVAGPRRGGVATIPASVRLRGVFINGKTAVIDFSSEIMDDFSGGSTAEYIMISSLVQTVCGNFPQMEAVRILVDGEEVETLGGHLSVAGSLRPQEWR